MSFWNSLMGLVCLSTFVAIPVYADERSSDVPEWLGEFKKLDEKELANKKEGWYATGLPLFGNDAVNGSGLGLLANVFYNGTKNDSSFKYTPYEHMFNVGVYRTNRGTENNYLAWDAPYFLDTAYRLRSYVGHDASYYNQYFGVGTESLQPLYFRDRNADGSRIVRNATYSDFENANSYAKNRGPGREFTSTQHYHDYQFETTYGQFNADKTIFQVFRVWGGVEFSKNIVRRYDGNSVEAKDPLTGITVPAIEDSSKLTEDSNAKKIIGVHGGNLNYMRGGIAFDTRDYEPDPDRGWLIEYNVNKAERSIGSDFNYLRHFGQIKNFYQPFPKLFEEFVIAQRAALTKIEGEVPFFEYRYLFSIDGPMGALGGQNTLRGYRQERFVGPVIGFYNIELRYRVGSFTLWDQFFQLSIVPFYDVGRVWDKIKQVSTMDYKHSRGLGLRLIWDQATVILMDYAYSREDQLFYLDIGHTF
ncbi:peptide-binding protein [Leptospira levettii]|uniref:Omp85 family outer membrane protein n=2 Tax=Leptospira levettii TaxID=2023178 RepID=UPI000C2ACA33|nr:DUF5982 domain-containing protein [Leptospira levettii]PJZ36423.1 peptide-binding protein [Leptospira levettii]PJZ87706.1 peptide-binding protein [Leptospira levettii]